MGKLIKIYAAKKSEVHQHLTELHDKMMQKRLKKKQKIKTA